MENYNRKHGESRDDEDERIDEDKQRDDSINDYDEMDDKYQGDDEESYDEEYRGESDGNDEYGDDDRDDMDEFGMRNDYESILQKEKRIKRVGTPIPLKDAEKSFVFYSEEQIMFIIHVLCQRLRFHPIVLVFNEYW